MTTIVDVDATWVNPNTVQYNAVELRLADAAMFAGRGDTYGARGGIVRHSDTALQVSVDGSDVVTVKAGSVVIPGTAVTGTGVWRTGISSDQTHGLAARDATNPRIDLVVFRQLDTDVVGSHGAYTARLQIIEGTPSATPAVPSLPTMAIELGRINVPASGGGAASADLTKRQFATALGAEMVVPTATQLPVAAAKWQRARALDTGAMYTFDGTAWGLDLQVATGGVSFGGSAGFTTAASLTLGPGRWLVQGKGTFDWSVTNTAIYGSLGIVNPSNTVLDRTQRSYGTAAGLSPATVMTVQALTAASTVLRLIAQPSAVQGTQLLDDAVLIAHRV